MSVIATGVHQSTEVLPSHDSSKKPLSYPSPQEGGEALTIQEIVARPVIAPFERPLRTAIGEIPAAPLVLIDICTREAVTGRSYLFGYTKTVLAALTKLVEDIGAELVGRRVEPVARMNEFDRRFRLLGWQGLVGMAVSGIDMALWDALAQNLGKPLAVLLGGSMTPLPAYDSFGMIDPKKDAGSIRKSLAKGFRAIKIKIGGGTLEHDFTVVSAVRDIIGPGVALMVDYNQSLDPVEARRRIKRLAPFDLAWVEEPVAAEDLEGHAKVRAVGAIPIQTGENWWFPSDMQKAIAAKASDLAMLDVMKIGGVTGWLRAMGLAQAASLPVSSHLFVEASAHLLAVTPTAHWLEFLDIAAAILSEPNRIVDGRIAPRGLGLGIEWDEREVERRKAG
jgi:mandelate racemase